jgi:hypothetical protein
VCFVVIEAQVEGSTIPEVVDMETTAGEVESAVPVACVSEGVAPGPGALIVLVFVTGNLPRGVPDLDECGLVEIGNSKEETRGTQFSQDA